MKNTRTVTGEVIRIERMRTSRNGNPRYQVTIGEPGDSVTAVTAPDSLLAYEVNNHYGKRVVARIGEYYGRDTLADIEREG